MKKWFNILIYISLIFLAYKLYQANYLKIPKIHNMSYLFMSLILLSLGMIANTVCWSNVLRVYGYSVSYSKGLAAVGLSVFTKYIPGKILMILGRAEYISQQYSISRKSTSTLSLITQLISIWTGLTLGILGIILLGGNSKLEITIISIIVWLLFVVLIFTPTLGSAISYIVKFLGKSNFKLPVLQFKQTLKVIPYFILNWGLWCLSFYFLCLALTFNCKITIITGLAFALGGSVGIISIITPGGLGVREGVIGGFLLSAGLTTADSTTLAVASRLWFLFGEIFIFIFSILISKMTIKYD